MEKNKKLNKYIITFLIIFIILISNYYLFFIKKQYQNTKISTGQTIGTSTGQDIGTSTGQDIGTSTGKIIDQTTDWIDYTNNDYGFTLKYPNNFFDIGNTPNSLSGDCNYQYFPNICPNINTIVTDLVNYNNGDNIGEKITINETPYCLTHIQDAGMGHVYNNYYYTTIKNNKCFIISLTTSTTNCDFYLPLEDGNFEQKQNYNNCIIKNQNQPGILKQIISTFKFVK